MIDRKFKSSLLFFLILYLGFGNIPCNGQVTITPNIIQIEKLPSKYVSPRDVYIRLPVDYDSDKAYPVLYMHDGQMIFRQIKTWNNQSWCVDSTITDLVSNNLMEDVIVIGISNIASERHSNYYPEKPFLSLDKNLQDSLYVTLQGSERLYHIPINSDDYLKFIVSELKPFIDDNYSTLKGLKNTFIAGSSMGGLISMYAFYEYPTVFGGAACLSTHWIGHFKGGESIASSFIDYIDSRICLHNDRKIYFDTGDQGLDAYYVKHQRKLDALYHEKGIPEDRVLSKLFKGASHMEDHWKSRLHIPLIFLLNKSNRK